MLAVLHHRVLQVGEAAVLLRTLNAGAAEGLETSMELRQAHLPRCAEVAAAHAAFGPAISAACTVASASSTSANALATSSFGAFIEASSPVLCCIVSTFSSATKFRRRLDYDRHGKRRSSAAAPSGVAVP